MAFSVSDSQKALDDVLLEERPIATLTLLRLGSKQLAAALLPRSGSLKRYFKDICKYLHLLELTC